MSRTKWKNKTSTRAYYAWHAMRARCTKTTHHKYADYGGRGIKYDPSWDSYDNFIEDMGECAEGLSLDRIDNNGNYCKDNCRWADRRTQNNNQRTNIIVTHLDKTLTITQWAREMGVRPNSLQKRLNKMSPEQAVRLGRNKCQLM